MELMRWIIHANELMQDRSPNRSFERDEVAHRGGLGPGPLKEARSCLSHRVYDQRAIQKKIPCFAAGLRYQETAVARRSMQRSVIIGSGGIVVSTYGIAGTKTLPFQSGLENLDKPPCDLDETAQRALIACGGGVDQDPALNRLP